MYLYRVSVGDIGISGLAQPSFALSRLFVQNMRLVSVHTLNLSVLCEFKSLLRTAVRFQLWHVRVLLSIYNIFLNSLI